MKNSHSQASDQGLGSLDRYWVESHPGCPAVTSGKSPHLSLSPPHQRNVPTCPRDSCGHCGKSHMEATNMERLRYYFVLILSYCICSPSNLGSFTKRSNLEPHFFVFLFFLKGIISSKIREFTNPPAFSFLIFLIFLVLATLHSLRDLSSPIRDWTRTPAVEVGSPNHWSGREVPQVPFNSVILQFIFRFIFKCLVVRPHFR